ncbi:hypothetical protein LTR17_006189 [Elasticomyces elasticus]|nr:hypothetical protein LTR17_006189 [Elasticomyces elasticus]
MPTRRPKPKDGSKRQVTRLDQMDGSSYTSTIHPTLRKETSSMRDILPELHFQHTLRTTSYRALRKRLDKTRQAHQDFVKFGGSRVTYHVDLVDHLLTLARANLPNAQQNFAGRPPLNQPNTASSSDDDVHEDDETMEDANIANHDADTNAGDDLTRDHETATGMKRKMSSSVDGSSPTGEGKRRMTAANTREGPIVEGGEDDDAVAQAMTALHVTQSVAEAAPASVATQDVNPLALSQDEQMLFATQHFEAPVPKAYTSKAEYEADPAVLKHRLPKAEHGTPGKAQTEIALNTVKTADNTLGVAAEANSDVEEDDEAGDGSDAQIETGPSAWHTSKSFHDGRADTFTPKQATETDEIAASCPVELWRVSAATGSNHTQGSTTSQRIKPAAAVEGVRFGEPVYEDLSDFPSLSSLSKNVAGRLLSTRSSADQLSSYSKDLEFILALAQRREHLGQGPILITRIVTRQIKTSHGKQAKFYSVPELLRALGVPMWKGLTEKNCQVLSGARFSHEYVAVGELDLTNNPYKPVSFDELKAHGLYNFRPGLHIEGNEVEEKKLYYRRLQMSHHWYGLGVKGHPNDGTLQFTDQYLNHAAQLARLFKPSMEESGAKSHIDDEVNTPQAPLSIFLDLVSLSVREKNSFLFAQHICDNYSSNDVQETLYQGMERIPNNSPDRMQVMQLTREACLAVGVPQPAATAVVIVDPLFDYDGVWHGNLTRITGAIQAWQKPSKALKAGFRTTTPRMLEDSSVAKLLYLPEVVTKHDLNVVQTNGTTVVGADQSQVALNLQKIGRQPSSPASYFPAPELTGIEQPTHVRAPTATMEAVALETVVDHSRSRRLVKLKVRVTDAHLARNHANVVSATKTNNSRRKQRQQLLREQARSEDLFTRFVLWYQWVTLIMKFGKSDMKSTHQFDDEMRHLLDECRRQAAGGIRLTCWMSGMEFSPSNAWLTHAVLLAETESAEVVKDSARMAAIRTEHAAYVARKIGQPALGPVRTDSSSGCASDGCGTIDCGVCRMRPKNKHARKELERKQGASWKFAPAGPNL